jgi:hypothetical protein
MICSYIKDDVLDARQVPDLAQSIALMEYEHLVSVSIVDIVVISSIVQALTI